MTAVQTTQLIAQPPSEVLEAVLGAIANEDKFTLDVVLRNLAEVPPAIVDGLAVSTQMQTSIYGCRNNFDLVPAAIWATVCEKDGLVERYHFSGTPGVGRGESDRLYALDQADTVRFSYRVDDAREQAESLSLALDDVSATFRNEWPGHLPFMNDVLSFARADDVLMIIQTQRDGVEAVRNIESITVYSRR